METVCRWHGGPPASAHHDRRDTRTQHAPSAAAQLDIPRKTPVLLDENRAHDHRRVPLWTTLITAVATVTASLGAIWLKGRYDDRAQARQAADARAAAREDQQRQVPTATS